MEQKQLVTVSPGNYEAQLRENIKVETEQADLALRSAEKLVIKDDGKLKEAKEDTVIIRNRIGDLEDKRKGIVSPLNMAVKAINELFKGPADKFSRAKYALETKVAEYEREKEQRRLAEEKRLREEAEREERKKREEKERQEREWREKEAKAKREAEEAERKAKEATNAKARAEAEEKARKAREEAAKAAAKAADRAVEAAEVVVIPKTVETEEVKVSGFRKKTVKWYAKVINPSQVPQEYAGRKLWMIDEKALNDLATALKTPDCPIPGVRFYSE